ncbi:hypothetical protein KCO_04747 [Pectobacterium brasiliense ICMP 19477]|nr:hypothetical protein PCC21_038980 [Pectobacterium carotovorum subsp. carotovorum PCC21]KMK85521.1 hypothetical protein KCO_04747 [Pectobacterium brasiliense ICMP 19477]
MPLSTAVTAMANAEGIGKRVFPVGGVKFFLAFINKVIHLKMRSEKDAPVFSL